MKLLIRETFSSVAIYSIILNILFLCSIYFGAVVGQENEDVHNQLNKRDASEQCGGTFCNTTQVCCNRDNNQFGACFAHGLSCCGCGAQFCCACAQAEKCVPSCNLNDCSKCCISSSLITSPHSALIMLILTVMFVNFV